MITIHDEHRPVQITRRLSVLPAVVGLVGVGWVLVGAWVAGLTATDRGWTWAVLAALAVSATVLTGSVTGLYSGLGLLIAVALIAADVEGRLELLGLCLFFVVAHETVRFSLDARRPARFDRRLLTGTFVRTGALAAVVTMTVLLLHPLTQSEPRRSLWIPLGLAGAGLPLLARNAARLLERFSPSLGPAARAGIAAAAAMAVLALVTVGAQARTAIDSGPGPGSGSDATTTATSIAPTPPPPLAGGIDSARPAGDQRWLVLALLGGVTLLAAALYLALRRPEAVFDLGDPENGDDDRSLGLSSPGRADIRQGVEVDDDDLVRLLADLRLDIEAEPDPGRAVRYAYANVESRLAALHLPRSRSETEREYLERALVRVGTAGPAMAELTSLFEQARFATEPADEAMRQRALGAIADLETALGSGVDGGEARP